MTAHDNPIDAAAMDSVAPPTKRARLSETSPVSVASPLTPLVPRLPVLLAVPNGSVHSPSEQLQRVLLQGVVGFLTLADATALVQTSRGLRTDTQLLTACARLVPDFQRLFPDEASVVFRLSPDRWVQQLRDAPVATPELSAQVVSTAWFLQKRVAKWCFEFNPQRPHADDDLLCSVQPVLIPLALFRDPATPHVASPPQPGVAVSAVSTKPTTRGTKWSRTPIKESLNAFCAGGGDAFFDDKSAAESRFATHWDSIYVDRVTGRVSCRLCDAARDAVALYKQQVETGLRQHDLLLRCQEATWTKKTLDERAQLAAAFRAKCFPVDAYIRPECAQWSDAQLLRHICEHGKLQAWQIGDTRARGIASPDALLRAVSHKYQHQCRTFYQPLKKSLHGKCHVIGRLPHATLQHLRHVPIQDDSETQNQRILTELVGGVDCMSGIFMGVQVTFRLTE